MAEVPALAADDDQAEVGGQPSARPALLEGLPLEAATDAEVLLILVLVPRARPQLLTHLHALFQRVTLPRLAPRHQFVRQEVAVAVVEDGAGRAVLELEVSSVVAG